MKLFVKLMLLAVIMAISGPYFIKGPDGAPLWSLRDTAASVSGLFSKLRSNPLTAAVTPGGEAVEIYRWQDADGQWHFTNVAPDDSPHSVLRIDPKTNAISTVVQRAPDESAAEPVADDPLARNTHIGPLPDPATAKALIEDARALQALADERARVMDNIN